jgi:hypothetical protein
MSLELVPILSDMGSEFIVGTTPGIANENVESSYVEAPATLSSCSSSWRMRDFNFSSISRSKELSINRPQSHGTTYGVRVELRDSEFFSSLSDRSYWSNLAPLRVNRAAQVGKKWGKVLYAWSGLDTPRTGK